MNDADIRALDRLIADIQFAGWHGPSVDWRGRPAQRRPRRAAGHGRKVAARALATR